MKRWSLLIVLLLSLGLNLGLVASWALRGRSAPQATAPAPEEPDEQPDRLPRVVYRMADELRLEGEKRDAFIDIQRTFFEQTISARSRTARLQQEVRRQVTSETPDRERLDEILVELAEAHTDLERAFVYNLLDSRELLDFEQERRFRQFLRRMRQVRGEVEHRFRERWKKRLENRRRMGDRRPPLERRQEPEGKEPH